MIYLLREFRVVLNIGFCYKMIKLDVLVIKQSMQNSFEYNNLSLKDEKKSEEH